MHEQRRSECRVHSDFMATPRVKSETLSTVISSIGYIKPSLCLSNRATYVVPGCRTFIVPGHHLSAVVVNLHFADMTTSSLRRAATHVARVQACFTYCVELAQPSQEALEPETVPTVRRAAVPKYLVSMLSVRKALVGTHFL